MADVRTVFRGLWVLAIISVVVLVAASRRADRGRTWRAVRGGAIGLSIGVVIAGVVGFFAFDQLFELFHTIFFPAGSYLFDPTHGPARPAVPVPVLVRDRDGRRGRDHRRRARRGVRGGPASRGAPAPLSPPRTWRRCRNPARERAAGRRAAQRRGRARRGPRRHRPGRHGTDRRLPTPSGGSPPRPSSARVSLPPWPNSAMDGYAIRAADTAAATEEEPVELRVIGDIAAGAAPERDGRARNGRPHRDRRTPPRRRRCRRPGRATTPLDAAGQPGPARPRRDRARAGRLPGPRAGRARRLGPRRRERPRGRRDPPASRHRDHRGGRDAAGGRRRRATPRPPPAAHRRPRDRRRGPRTRPAARPGRHPRRQRPGPARARDRRRRRGPSTSASRPTTSTTS